MDGNLPTLTTRPLTSLRVWPGNPRKTIPDLTDLTASIRRLGVLSPLLIRPLATPDGDVTHEVIAGQCRYLAADLAGLDEVPVNEREVDDCVALELGLIENSQRESPSPLEEAEAIERLTRDHGRTVEQVANKLGRTVAWVRRRLTLLGLGEAARERMRRGELPLAHAERLAVLDAETQARVLSRCPDELPASGAFAREIMLSLHSLANAPFDIEDAKLPGGSCSRCSKRSDSQADLFASVSSAAGCPDAACWSKKNDASWARVERDAKKRKLPIIDAKGVLASYGVPGTIEYTAPYLSEPPTPDAKPVAIARHFRGHAVELYAKPERVATKAIVTREDLEDDGPSPEEIEREARAKAAKEAAQRAKIEKLLAVTQSGHGLALLWRVAAQALSLAGFERDIRAVVAANGGLASTLLPVDELVSGADAPRVLAAALAHEWALFASGDDDHTDAEKELRALLDAPLAAEAPAVASAPPAGCADCGDAAALVKPGETIKCVCGRVHTRVETVRVWIAESDWDALDAGLRSYLHAIELPDQGDTPVAIEWQGTEGYVFADVPRGEVLDELCATLRQADVPFTEGAERPTPDEPKPTKKARAKKATKKTEPAPAQVEAAPVMSDADRAAFVRELDASEPRIHPSVPDYLRDLAERAAEASDGAWWIVVTAGQPKLSDRVTVSRCPDLDTARARCQLAKATDVNSNAMHRMAVFSPEGEVVSELTWTRHAPESPTLAKHPDAALFRISARIDDVFRDAQTWAIERGLCWYSSDYERLTPDEALAGDALVYWHRENSEAIAIVPRDFVLFIERRASKQRDDGSVRAELRIEPWPVPAEGHDVLRSHPSSVVVDHDGREWRVDWIRFDKVHLWIDEDTVTEADPNDITSSGGGARFNWRAIPKKAPKKSAKKGGAK